jgi:hypothetical protein
MRLCPSVEGSASPLITHRIGVEVCMARQRTFFHKCHRCIYRGQPANWAPEHPPMAAVDLDAASPEHSGVGAKPIVIDPAPAPAPRSKGKAKPKVKASARKPAGAAAVGEDD